MHKTQDYRQEGVKLPCCRKVDLCWRVSIAATLLQCYLHHKEWRWNSNDCSRSPCRFRMTRLWRQRASFHYFRLISGLVCFHGKCRRWCPTCRHLGEVGSNGIGFTIAVSAAFEASYRLQVVRVVMNSWWCSIAMLLYRVVYFYWCKPQFTMQDSEQ